VTQEAGRTDDGARSSGGTPEKVADDILRLRDEIELDHLLCAPLSHESFLLLTDEVLPRLG
jgi:alkanesulfonate monooxygenase SsuD/methylene tetrahydromethanopterin reductase-like flavin-dependent oxidoreductase (luciferase family)